MRKKMRKKQDWNRASYIFPKNLCRRSFDWCVILLDNIRNPSWVLGPGGMTYTSATRMCTSLRQCMSQVCSHCLARIHARMTGAHTCSLVAWYQRWQACPSRTGSSPPHSCHRLKQRRVDADSPSRHRTVQGIRPNQRGNDTAPDCEIYGNTRVWCRGKRVWTKRGQWQRTSQRWLLVTFSMAEKQRHEKEQRPTNTSICISDSQLEGKDNSDTTLVSLQMETCTKKQILKWRRPNKLSTRG